VTRRITQFLGRGFAVIWLVDPEGRSVTIYRLNQLPQVFEGADELPGDPELPEFRCRVADLFYLPGEEEASGSAGQGGAPETT
jgi:Uma2 family endonuclease